MVVTNSALKLEGKYSISGIVLVTPLKILLRLLGVGEVYKEIPIREIKGLRLKKKALLTSDRYLEFRAEGKTFKIYTDAAQHIFNLLKQYGAETV